MKNYIKFIYFTIDNELNLIKIYHDFDSNDIFIDNLNKNIDKINYYHLINSDKVEIDKNFHCKYFGFSDFLNYNKLLDLHEFYNIFHENFYYTFYNGKYIKREIML